MKIFLGSQLNFYHPQKGNWLDEEIDKPTPLSEILTGLGIPFGEIHLVVINGEVADIRSAIVSQQDEVKLYPPVGGG